MCSPEKRGETTHHRRSGQLEPPSRQVRQDQNEIFCSKLGGPGVLAVNFPMLGNLTILFFQSLEF
jgi:hypothetical protein